MGVALRLNQGLGVAVLRPARARGVAPPRPGHQQTERGVDDGKDPERRLVVQDNLYPVRDEATCVAHLASLKTKPRLQDGERAVLTEPSLKRDNTDCGHVRQTPPAFICPRPPCPVPNDDGRESQHHEYDDPEVQEKNSICKCLVWQRGGPCDA